MDDLEEWVARELFIGEWVDEKGGTWVFGPAGDLRTPDRRVRYAMEGDLDGFPTGFYDDVLFIDGKAYDFVRRRKRMKLYVPSEADHRRDRKPVHTLTMVHSRPR